jgi:hypothetical protein
MAQSRRPTRALARPLPGLSSAAVVVPLTLASLVVNEFPTHVLIAESSAALALARRGALRHRSGVVGLLIAVGALVQLLAVLQKARNAGGVLEASLQSTRGQDYRVSVTPDCGIKRPATWRDVWLPRFTERSRYLRQENLSYGDRPQQEELLTKIVIGASQDEAYEIWDQGSPLSHVRPDAPPMFVIHGDIDTFTNHEQARAFAWALGAVSRNPVAHAELPGSNADVRITEVLEDHADPAAR